jgi:NADH/NAD ratio-sensing transcriptional regulator Rex
LCSTKYNVSEIRIAEDVKAILRHTPVSLQLRDTGLTKVKKTTYTINLPHLFVKSKDLLETTRKEYSVLPENKTGGM